MKSGSRQGATLSRKKSVIKINNLMQIIEGLPQGTRRLMRKASTHLLSMANGYRNLGTMTNMNEGDDMSGMVSIYI